jgi:hypothetical protein
LGDETFLRSHSAGKDDLDLAPLIGDSLRPAYCFVQNNPGISIDTLGLNVYKVREPGTPGCCDGHRYIVGDDGRGGWYVIQAIGADGMICGCTRNPSGPSHILYNSGPRVPATAFIKSNQPLTITDTVSTSAATDAYLNKLAKNLNNSPWDYVWILNDCGTFANLWLDTARNWEAAHPAQPGKPTPSPKSKKADGVRPFATQQDLTHVRQGMSLVND